MTRIVDNEQDDGINWQYMRYGDIFMMAAEAINALDGPDAAWPYLEPILSRALPAEKVSALKAKYTASKDAFFDGIVEQRAFEFGKKEYSSSVNTKKYINLFKELVGQ